MRKRLVKVANLQGIRASDPVCFTRSNRGGFRVFAHLVTVRWRHREGSSGKPLVTLLTETRWQLPREKWGG